MQQRKSFKSVLLNSDDQVLVRRLLHEFLTERQKEEIVDAFNKVAKTRELNRREVNNGK
jgi:predicted Zn-ribbon and HTH transcriptional regulator